MGYDADLAFVFLTNTKMVFGKGTCNDVGVEMESLGKSKAMLVTDKMLTEKTELVDRIKTTLGNKCVGVFDDVPSDSSVEAVETGAEFAKEKGADCLVSLGGGSVMDTAKGMAVILTEGASAVSMHAADIVCTDIVHALELLMHPLRLTATLRS